MLKSIRINKNRRAIIVTLQIFIIFFVMIKAQIDYNNIGFIYDEMYMRKIVYLQAYSIVNNVKVNAKNTFLYLMHNNISSSNLIENMLTHIIDSTLKFYNNSLIDDNTFLIIILYNISLKVIANNTITVLYFIVLKFYDTSGYASLILRVDDVLIFMPR